MESKKWHSWKIRVCTLVQNELGIVWNLQNIGVDIVFEGSEKKIRYMYKNEFVKEGDIKAVLFAELTEMEPA